VVDAAGVVYFSDSFNNRVRKLMPQMTALAPLAMIEAVVVNSASQQPGPVAPGELVTIYAAGIGPEVGTPGRPESTGTMGTTLAETQVLFDGKPAPLIYVQSGQINLQVPYGVGGTTEMEVLYKGASRLKQTLPVADSAPGIFPAVSNQDGTQNSATNPAARDSVVTFYATGEGVVDPAGVTGRPGQPPFGQPVLAVSVRIGGNPADVLYAASAPGQVGMIQISARVPGGFVPTGMLPLVLQVGTASSQSGVTMAVK
jgi:uncharacterized protein (TIGR03437 family)